LTSQEHSRARTGRIKGAPPGGPQLKKSAGPELRKLGGPQLRKSTGSSTEEILQQRQIKELQRQIKELQRLLGKKTLVNEILKEAVEVVRTKKSTCCALRDRRGAPLGGSSVLSTWSIAQ